ncbi:mitochondrial fission regulator 2 isoform X1 [Crotalus tigris]|uniref:mitochondrial fission regulator 2 isoform X1 n=1 Tax=Crotalus tigris TaxID=88082 RepID=UPI00192F4155|nr:mitochondrial fission regulator 2 isoform X1 [Crotalus tigris]XP_039179342.1 mitochondrial fission regulator 2 isoform X1 [Crotalus tigris]XP_039179350.1 mitochondrial fission regulator 2 isoform X1 [Crotalus tigris]
MSLLLNLLRQLLEYYGVVPEPALQRCKFYLNGLVRMIGSRLSSNAFSRRYFQELCIISRNCLISWVSERKRYGSTRSFVRRLGACLTLIPFSRPHFQLVQSLNSLEEQYSIVNSVQLSLADALWMVDEDRNPCTKFRFEDWRGVATPSVLSLPITPKEKNEKTTVVGEDAFQKIHVLENELAHLRKQIAAILAADRAVNDQSRSDTGTLSNTPNNFLQPGMFSTPAPTSLCNVVIPPPPPLPPSFVLKSDFDSRNSAVQLIKQRRAIKTEKIKDNAEHQTVKVIPDMMDVLKDINNVKLRAIEKSPGGTPLPKRNKIKQSQWDPAALIAEALKEKFASQSSRDDSFDKENSSYGTSPFSSPDTPMVDYRILKPSTKQRLNKTEKLINSSSSKSKLHM